MARMGRMIASAVGRAALVLCLLPTAVAAGPTLLIDATTQEVLASDNADATWYPASLTKLMTAYLTFEAVKSGKVAWTDPVALTDKARGQPATRVGLKLGIPLTVEQAIRGVILRSANDFSMALAEKIGGSEEGFAELMNAAAKRLGMTRSHFTNPHGLPDERQVSTVRDMAILALALLRDFPDRAEVFSTPQFVIHKGMFHTQNDLLRTFLGADGMKTGFTCGAGFNVVASASRNGRRMIAVVLGSPTRVARSQLAAEMLQTGFDHLEGTKRVERPVKLAELAMSSAEPTIVHDMRRETQTRKCGNRGPRVQVAKAAKKKAAPTAEQAVAGNSVETVAKKPPGRAAAKANTTKAKVAAD
jgi:D-alanyl-D-alanine carboxypeptidase